jgi:hypothetical protein
MQVLTMSQLGGNALLTPSEKLLAVPDQVTAWWKRSPYPYTEIAGNAAMQSLALSQLGGNAHLTP